VIVRARPAPADIHEAIEIAAPLTGDIRLRLEEREAIDMLIKLARELRPTTRWTSPIDPTEDL
jgi:hypothetical protein